jgi:uncharacterized protein
MREDVEFDAGGVRLRGWLYLPDDATGPVPAIVIAHGFSAVKEMYLDTYAEVFAEAGLAALVFDNRNFGASDGEPRQEIDPWAQVRDYRDAITWVRTRPQVDAERIGVWGSSYGRYEGKAPGMVAVVDPDPSAPSALPTPDSWERFSRTGETRAPSWRNEVTLRSVELFTEYEPGVSIERIAPTPLLMVVAAGDHLTPADLALDAYGRAREAKRLELLPGAHFDAYTEDFPKASGAARVG